MKQRRQESVSLKDAIEAQGVEVDERKIIPWPKPEYSCVCEDTGWVSHEGRAVPCPYCEAGKNHRQRRLRAIFKDVGMPEQIYRVADFVNLPSEMMEGKELAIFSMYEFVKNGCTAMKAADIYRRMGDAGVVIENDVPRFWIVLAGSFGTGKSSLMCATAQAIDKAHPQKSVLVVNALTLYQRVKATFDDPHERMETVLQPAMEVDVLMIDDMNVAANGSAFLEEVFYTVLNERYMKRRPTVITTNADTAEDLGAGYGWQSASRIAEGFWFEMGGIPFRRYAGEMVLPKPNLRRGE